MDSWFREIHVLRAWRVYLAAGFDFREKSRAAFGSFGARICVPSPTLSLYYECKVKVTIFSRNFVYISRTTKARHMVSFIDFYFHFLANFQNFVSYVLSIYSCDTHCEPGLPVVARERREREGELPEAVGRR